MSTDLILKEQGKRRFSLEISAPKYQEMMLSVLTDKAEVAKFTASISSAVGTTPALQKCTTGSIITAGLVGAALKLPPSPQLGYFYMVPFAKKQYDRKTGEWAEENQAQFIIGYKGLLQLAMRTGMYKSINAVPIKEGELLTIDPIKEEFKFEAITDPLERLKAKTIGYYGKFTLNNGFTREIYTPLEIMEKHADTYSTAFDIDLYNDIKSGKVNPNDKNVARKTSSFWYKNFDDMACKTILRQLLGKYGILSTDLENAFTYDGTSSNESVSIDKREYFEAEINEDFKNSSENDVEEEQKATMGSEPLIIDKNDDAPSTSFDEMPSMFNV